MSFKQQVILVLLQNLEWMPKFENIEDAAEYMCENVPNTIGDTIALQQKSMAVLVSETANRIVEMEAASE